MMSLATTSPLSRGQLSPFTSSLAHELTNQQVPGSPFSPFLHAAARAHAQRGSVCSPSSGSPLAQVPDGGSPLLRHLLKRNRDADGGTPSPSPASKRSTRDSPRVPNSIIVVRRTAKPTNTTDKARGEQVVPTTPTPPPPEEAEEGVAGIRKLPAVTDNTKLLDLFGETKEIFASSREE